MKQKKGIEYAEKSWNPYSGCNGINNDRCAVGKKCWAYGMSLRMAGRFGYGRENPFKPTFHLDKLDLPLKIKKPKIFNSCFMGDIAYAKIEWLQQILEIVSKCPQHRFIFLTKEPHALVQKHLKFPGNVIIGVTVNQQVDTWRIDHLRYIDAKHRWISFEPVYGQFIYLDFTKINFVVIGSQTNPTIQPLKKWVEFIIKNTDKWNIPVFIKPNCTVVPLRMELPEILKI